MRDIQTRLRAPTGQGKKGPNPWLGKGKEDVSAEFAENTRARKHVPVPVDAPDAEASTCDDVNGAWTRSPQTLPC